MPKKPTSSKPISMSNTQSSQANNQQAPSGDKTPKLMQGKTQGPMRGGPGGHPGGGRFEKPKNFKGTMKKLAQYLKVFMPQFVIVVILAVAGTVFSIVGPKILGNAITAIFEGFMAKMMKTGGIDFERIAQIALWLLLLYAFSTLCTFVQGFIMSGISQKVSYSLRKDISFKINRLPLKFFDKQTHGEVLSRVTNDVDTVSQTLSQSLSQVVTSVTTIIGVIYMMLTINLTMTVIALLMVPLSFALVILIVKYSQKYFKRQQEYLGHINGKVEELYGGHLVVKAFNAEEHSIQEFDEINETLYHSAWKSQFLSGIMMPLMGFVGNLGYVAVVIVGSTLAVKKVIEVGDISSFMQYVRNFTQPINQTAQIANILQSTAAAAERVFEFLGETEQEPDTSDCLKDTKHLQSSVDFNKVHFGYSPDKIIINDFSASVLPGQKIAIVGPTGAGKTTLVKLIMRFYELNGGSISVGGVDVKKIERNALRSMFGMVLQDTWLYNASIMENIRYGRLDAKDEEVIQAAKLAHVHHFIKTLPGAYEHTLNEEATNISQGQKQLLTIARAIVANPQILILDEATSSVDTRTEVLIQEAMETLMKGRTSFIIAHRLSTIRKADSILVMRDGDIVEQGSHEVLLEKKGFYYELYNSQFEES